MPVDPRDILNVATTLSRMDSEASHRSAVSRTYYSAFHFGNEIIEQKLPLTNSLTYSGGCHQQLISKFKSGKSLPWQSIAYQVEHLRIIRVKADYHVRKTVLRTEVVEAIETAKNN
jgi:hypothetical protein